MVMFWCIVFANKYKELDPRVIVISGHKRIFKKKLLYQQTKNITGSQVCQGKTDWLWPHTTRAKKTNKSLDYVTNYLVIGECKASPHGL